MRKSLNLLVTIFHLCAQSFITQNIKRPSGGGDLGSKWQVATSSVPEAGRRRDRSGYPGCALGSSLSANQEGRTGRPQLSGETCPRGRRRELPPRISWVAAQNDFFPAGRRGRGQSRPWWTRSAPRLGDLQPSESGLLALLCLSL